MKKNNIQSVTDAPKVKKPVSPGVYVALTGLNYGDPEKRVEPGGEVSDLPADAVEWMLECGAIKPKEAE